VLAVVLPTEATIVAAAGPLWRRDSSWLVRRRVGHRPVAFRQLDLQRPRPFSVGTTGRPLLVVPMIGRGGEHGFCRSTCVPGAGPASRVVAGAAPAVVSCPLLGLAETLMDTCVSSGAAAAAAGPLLAVPAFLGC
jgi:hypothetical protein